MRTRRNRRLSWHMLLGTVVALPLAAPPSAPADSVTLAPEKDNTNFSDFPNNSNALGVLFNGVNNNGNIRRCLLAFDVAGALPPGSVVESATLTLTLLQASPGSGSPAHTLHRVLQDWGEGDSLATSGSGTFASAGDATWVFTFFPHVLWDEPGGDFELDDSATQAVGTTPGPFTWGSTVAMIQDVQRWLNEPDGNFGWMLLGEESANGTARKFASREYAVPELRPLLTIEFEPPGCPADIDADGAVDIDDVIAVILNWGSAPPGDPDADINGDGTVDVLDLLAVVVSWGFMSGTRVS